MHTQDTPPGGQAPSPDQVTPGGDVVGGSKISIGGDVSGAVVAGRDAHVTVIQEAAKIEVPPPPEPARPPATDGFVGREAELAYLAGKLASTHLAVITGVPGVGKTALAAVLAGRVHEPAKIFWHTLHE